MINVNFNKTKSSEIYHAQNTGLASSGTTFVSNVKEFFSKQSSGIEISTGLLIKVFINLMIIACFPLGLKIYEIRELDKLKIEKRRVDEVFSSQTTELASLKKELEGYSHLQEKAEEFSKKKEFLKKLAETRLIIPRTIDLIQNKIPNTVWLDGLSLKLSQEAGNQVTITGKSFSEADVNLFASSLNDILDQNSITVDTRDVKEGNSIVKVKFDLRGSM